MFDRSSKGTNRLNRISGSVKRPRRFDASLEWLNERIALPDEEIQRIRKDEQMERRAKSEKLKAVRMTSISEVLEEVEVLIDTHFFNEVS